jgi:hypothetical protein
MNVEEIAKMVCEKTYLKLCKPCESGTQPGYSFEQYWEKNKEYFTQQAKIYLEVKECLEAK